MILEFPLVEIGSPLSPIFLIMIFFLELTLENSVHLVLVATLEI